MAVVYGIVDALRAMVGIDPNRIWPFIAGFASVFLLLLGGFLRSTPPGCVAIAKTDDERPGMDAVRDARQAALRARRAVVALGAGLRERLLQRVEDLDTSVLAMAEVARGTSAIMRAGDEVAAWSDAVEELRR